MRKNAFPQRDANDCDATDTLQKQDLFPILLSGEKNFRLGITSDQLDEAQDAVRLGADWITFGWVLRTPDPLICKQWIDTIRAAKERSLS